MKRVLVCLALVALPACESAAKHPAITIGAVGGTLGFGLCELSVGDAKTCGIIGGTAALALGGITALVTLLADTNAHDDDAYLQNEDSSTPRESVTEPPPGLPAWMLDGGVAPPPATIDAAVVDGM